MKKVWYTNQTILENTLCHFKIFLPYVLPASGIAAGFHTNCALTGFQYASCQCVNLVNK